MKKHILTIVNNTTSNDAGLVGVQHITRLRALRRNDILRNKETITKGEGQSSKHHSIET